MRLLLVISLLLTAGDLGAQIRAATPPPAPAPDPLDALLKDSPFLPAAGPAAPAAEGGPLELRSVLFEGGRFLFSIYDQGTKESKWVGLGERDAPYVARSFDHENDVLTVEYQGRTVALKLPPAHVAGMAPQGGAPSPAPLPTPQEAARTQQPAPQPAPVQAPTGITPQESQRLQNMADEIRRRRQLPKK